MHAYVIPEGTPIKVIRRYKSWKINENFVDKTTNREQLFVQEDVVVDPLHPDETNTAKAQWAKEGWYGFSLKRFRRTTESWDVMLVRQNRLTIG